jgi:hypothetical protein
MKKTNLSESYNLFSKAVLFALIEQGKKDPFPLRAFLISILEDTPQSTEKQLGWLKDEITLKAFYNSLIKHGFVTCDLEFFKPHFNGNQHTNAEIIWNANLNELVYLFKRLQEETIIPLHKNPHVLLQENFLDKYEKPIKARSLRVLLEKGIRNSNRVGIIDDIISDVLSEENIKS